MAREAAARLGLFILLIQSWLQEPTPAAGGAVFSEEGRAVEEELGRSPLQAPPTVSPYMEYP